MVLHHLRCGVCRFEVESDASELPCLEHGCPGLMTWFRIIQRPDSDMVEGVRNDVGLIILTPNISDSSPRYKQWLNSDATQARLKLPDDHPNRLRHVTKSNDIMHY